jgi:hypothetical protein
VKVCVLITSGDLIVTGDSNMDVISVPDSSSMLIGGAPLRLPSDEKLEKELRKEIERAEFEKSKSDFEFPANPEKPKDEKDGDKGDKDKDDKNGKPK